MNFYYMATVWKELLRKLPCQEFESGVFRIKVELFAVASAESCLVNKSGAKKLKKPGRLF